MSQINHNVQKNINNIIIQKPKSSSLSPDTIKCKKIGNYILSNTIGTGTFSKVKLGIHLSTQQKVAIKILDRDKIKDENDIERISREIQILKVLRHNNIAQLYENITSERHIYIIMEYIDGKDLFQYIYSLTKLNEIKASCLFRQLISALEYIHTLGVVHRDIKPENILLTKDHKNIKLVDFGLSNSYRHGNLLKTACGSPCYAAPEMISGKEYNGLYSDLWSCGVVLYCMLCGKLPFDDEKIKVLYRKIKTGDYIIPHYLSDISQDVLKRILTVNPDKRIRLKDLKNHPFFNLDKIPLCKGILVGIDEISVDYNLVKEVKNGYFKDKDKISEDYIIENISQNNHNSITAIYYLLLKKKEEEKKIDMEKKKEKEKLDLAIKEKEKEKEKLDMENIEKEKTELEIKEKEKNELEIKENKELDNKEKEKKSKKESSQTVSERKKTDIFNLNTIKKISFENTINKNKNSNNDNMNLNNSNNRFNVVVINNILAEQNSNNSNILKNNKKNPESNVVAINLDSQTKMNATTSLNNNVITTKINLNDIISNHFKKNNSRNISNYNYNGHKNQTLSLGGGAPPLMNNTTNIEHTLNTYKIGFKKDMKKFIFNSPNSSEENLKIILKKNNTKTRAVSTNLSRNIKTINQAKTQFKNDGKSKRENLNRFINQIYIKKLFENESSFNNESNINNGNNNISLNLTSYISNPRKQFYNFKSNSLNKRPLKSTHHSKQNSKIHSNIYEMDNSHQKVPIKNFKAINNNKKMITTESINLNSFLRNRFSLSLKTQNTSKEKGKNLQKKFKTNSVSKERDKIFKKRTTSLNNNNNNKTFMSGQSNINSNLNNTSKTNKNNNHLNQNIKTKKNNIIGIGPVNFRNVIRKNISREKKQKITTITNYTIHNNKLKFGKAITSTHNSKEKNIHNSIKSSSSSNQKNNNEKIIKSRVPRKNLSIKI